MIVTKGGLTAKSVEKLLRNLPDYPKNPLLKKERVKFYAINRIKRQSYY